MTTEVSFVMTPNPSCVSPQTSALVALKAMVSGKFRHLPVADHGRGNVNNVSVGLFNIYYLYIIIVVGLLDITKCLFDVISRIEYAYEASSKKFSIAVEKVTNNYNYTILIILV